MQGSHGRWQARVQYVISIRVLPGSNKSTFRRIVPGVVRLETCDSTGPKVPGWTIIQQRDRLALLSALWWGSLYSSHLGWCGRPFVGNGGLRSPITGNLTVSCQCYSTDITARTDTTGKEDLSVSVCQSRLVSIAPRVVVEKDEPLQQDQIGRFGIYLGNSG